MESVALSATFASQGQESSRPTTNPTSPRHSTRESTINSSPTKSEVDSTDDLSSDDEDGVFIGDHQAGETALALKLSLLSPTAPAPTSRAGRRLSERSVPSSLKRRDSREFHRRKTILWPLKGNVGNDEQKVWEGGFYERKDGSDPSHDSATSQRTVYFSTRTNDQANEDGSSSSSRSTVFFSASASTPTRAREKPMESSTLVPISDEPRARISGSESPECDANSEVEEDSDKENMSMTPQLEVREEGDINGGGQPFVAGMEAEETEAEDDEDPAMDLNMGGLHISDFDDPEGDLDIHGDSGVDDISHATTPEDAEETDNSLIPVDSMDQDDEAEINEGQTEDMLFNESEQHIEMSLGGDNDPVDFEASPSQLSPEGSEDIDPSPAPETSEPAQDDEGESRKIPHAVHHLNADSTPKTTHVAEDDSNISPFVPSDPDGSPAGEDAPIDTSQSPTSSRNSSSSSGSPLPIARGGPVVIPQIPAHLLHLRESLSPTHALSPPQMSAYAPYNPSPEGQDKPFFLTSMTSPPSRPSPHYMHTPNSTSIPPGPSIAGPVATPASHNAFVNPYDQGTATKSKMLKSTMASSAVTASVDRSAAVPGSAKLDRKTAARAMAIRGRLDAAFRDKPISSLGPPQRTVSSSSSNSASSKSSRAAGPVRPSHQASTAPKTTSAVSAPGTRPAQSAAASAVSQVKPSTSAHPAPRPRPSVAPGFAQPTLASSRAASSKPPLSSTIKPTLIKSTTRPVPRPPLAPRSIPQPSVRPSSALGHAGPPRLIPAKPASFSAPAPRTTSPELVETARTINPLKRPLPSAQPTFAKSLVSASGAPPRLGLPARMIRQGGPTTGPVFSVGYAGPESTGGSSLGSVRPAYRSPGKFGKRTYGSPMMQDRRLGTPSRMGTPSRAGQNRPIAGSFHARREQRLASDMAPPLIQANAATQPESVEQNCPNQPPAENPPQGDPGRSDTPPEQPAPSSSPPPAPFSNVKVDEAHDQHHLGGQSSTATKASPDPPNPPTSATQEAVGSPARPKRAIRQPSTFVPMQNVRQPSAAAQPSIAPNMSDKELKAMTLRHTHRNEVYTCAIERQVVRRSGKRPDSPSSKIRTVADRDEADRKAGREERAKRRLKGSGAEEEDEDEDPPTVVFEQVTKFRGDEEGYVSPPRKKVKLGHGDKALRWDMCLTVRRDYEDGSKSVEPAVRSGIAARSAFSNRSALQLDQHGNIAEGSRPVEQLKRSRVPVTCVLYDGEEPLPVPAYSAALVSDTGKAKGKKKHG